MIRVARPLLRVSPLALGLLGAAGLAAVAAGLWPVDADAPAAASGTPPLDLGSLAAGDTGAALTRPLFDPERRAWTAHGSREDLTAQAGPPTLLSVRGILIEDRIRRALVADGTGAPTWMVPGESRGAWRLVSIEPAQVVVTDSARDYTLAFLGAPVALRPVPRHPAPALRPALGQTEDAPGTVPAERVAGRRPAEGAAPPVRRIEIVAPDPR